MAQLGGEPNSQHISTWFQHDHDCFCFWFFQFRKKYQHFSVALRASFLIEFLTFYSILFWRKESQSFVIYPLKKTCIYVTFMSITIAYTIWGYTKPKKKYNKDYIGLLGLLQTIREKQGKKDRETSNRKTILEYGQTKHSQVLPGNTYYLGLHRPTMKGL